MYIVVGKFIPVGPPHRLAEMLFPLPPRIFRFAVHLFLQRVHCIGTLIERVISYRNTQLFTYPIYWNYYMGVHATASQCERSCPLR